MSVIFLPLESKPPFDVMGEFSDWGCRSEEEKERRWIVTRSWHQIPKLGC